MNLISRLMREIRGRSAAGTGDQTDAEKLRGMIATGRVEEAQSWLQGRLAEDPDDVDSMHLLGLLHIETGNPGEAARLIGLAVERAPDVPFLHSNLAKSLSRLGRLDEAERHYEEAAALAPDTLDVRLDLAAFLIDRGRDGRALEALNRVFALDPGNGRARSLAATALTRMGRPREAITGLKEALNDNPDDARLFAQLFMLQAEACDWSQDRDGFVKIMEKWAAAPLDGRFDGLHPFIAWHVDVPDWIRLAVTQGYADRVRATAGPRLPQREFSRPARRNRLRIGYLSADFHNHPTMHLIGGLFRQHDRARFEIFAYSLGPDDRSEIRGSVVRAVERFVDLRQESSRSCAQIISADGIDVLIDLKGYTLDARPEVLALRPAPLQIAWLGYPATLGIGLVDYAIVDATVAPRDGQSEFGEALLRLPCCYQVTDGASSCPEVAPRRRDVGLHEGDTVFGCFNAQYKIEPVIFAVWMRILRRVPGSVLWLYHGNDWSDANLRREAAEQGIDASRLIFGGTLHRPAHLGRLRCADLLLDTHGINAHTGAADAMWAGVPLLTCLGRGFPSRVAASVLRAAGVPELVCDDLAAYENAAVSLARSPRVLGELRERLSLREAPYFDTARMFSDLERAIDLAWSRRIDGDPPADIDVPRA